MNVRECLNRALEHLPMVDNLDLSILAGVLADIDIIASNKKLPEVLRKQASRINKLGEHIILDDLDFDSGIKKLTQSLSQLEKTLSDLEQTSRIPEDSNNESTEVTEESILSQNDLCELRIRFASQQKSTLEDFESYVLDFERNGPTAQGAIKRMLHTWKGEFGVLDLPKMSGLIHTIEDAIEKNTITTDGLLKLKDHLTNVFLKMASNQTVAALPAALFIKNGSAGPFPSDSIVKKCPETPLTMSSTTGTIPENDISLLHDFIQESRDHIHCAETLMLDLESDPTNTEFINSIFRSFHTIKGVSGFLGLKVVTELAHSIENIIDQARKGSLVIKPAHIDILLQSMDCLKEIIANIESGSDCGKFNIPKSYQSIIERLSVPDTIDIQFDNATVSGPVKKLGTMLVENGGILKEQLDKALQKQGDGDPRKIGRILVEDNGVPVRSVAEAIAVQSQLRSTKNVEETVRVPVNRIDQLIDTIGEAVIAQSMINASSSIHDLNDQVLDTKISHANVIMRQIQEMAMSLRMVSIKSTFQKMARLARDLGKKFEREIDFITEGEDTELDKSVVENIGDPLIHMIRNSIDHGIELPEEREKMGKPRKATIKLRAYHRAGNIIIEVMDDGRGLDKEAIYKKALSKGICNSSDLLTDHDIYQFIFLPGFSTAKKVTDVSGRGVGMDVVKRNVEALRGSVEITSVKGIGTTFSIRLPLTLAIVDGMVVKSGNESYIIPTLSILESLKPSEESIESVMGKGKMIKVREDLIPIVHLASLLSENVHVLNNDSGVIMVVEDMLGKRIGLHIDEILGQQQVVVKNLGNWMVDIPGITGGAIMNAGTISLIIDIGGIVKMAGV